MPVYTHYGGGIQALVVLAVLLLICGIIGGVLLGDTELLNPSIHAAQADKIEAEAEALRAETAAKAERAAADLEALQARRAVLLAMAPVLVMGVEDIDAAMERVVKAGGKIVAAKEPVGDMGIYARAVDTEGNVIGIFQILAK